MFESKEPAKWTESDPYENWTIKANKLDSLSGYTTELDEDSLITLPFYTTTTDTASNACSWSGPIVYDEFATDTNFTGSFALQGHVLKRDR